MKLKGTSYSILIRTAVQKMEQVALMTGYTNEDEKLVQLSL
jgi:hypothetical protein